MGAYILVFIVGFVLIAWWSWRNDSVPLDRETRGLFRMRQRNLVETDAAELDAPDRNR